MSARVRLLRLGVAVAATAAFGIGAAAPATAAPTNGANSGCGNYCPSGVGQPSGNGQAAEHANENGLPGAGTVGNADSKNPPGQAPDGSDDNKGYECDENQGVGQTNPAHSGCEPPSTSS